MHADLCTFMAPKLLAQNFNHDGRQGDSQLSMPVTKTDATRLVTLMRCTRHDLQHHSTSLCLSCAFNALSSTVLVCSV